MSRKKWPRWDITPASEFSRIQADWDALNRAGSDSPLLDARFFELLLAHIEPAASCGVASSGGRPIAAGIFGHERRCSWQTYQPSQAPMGAWVCRADADLQPVLHGLIRALPFSCLIVGITQQDPGIFTRPDGNGHLQTRDYIQTARVAFQGDFDAYWSERGNNLRHNVKRQRNRLNRDGVTEQLTVVTSPAEAAQAVDDFGRLESSGWKGEQGTALHPDNAQGRFYRAMITHYCERGEGMVCQYRYDGTLVASDICLQRHGIVYVLKTTYDEKQKATSPSTLMREALFRQYFDDPAVNAVEFYGRVMDWHKRWSDDIRTMFHVNWYRWQPLARMRKAG